MFKDIDANEDGVIEIDEWMTFWSKVKQSGYSENDIRMELDNIKKGQSWAHFEVGH